MFSRLAAIGCCLMLASGCSYVNKALDRNQPPKAKFDPQPVLLNPERLIVCSDIPYPPFEDKKGGKIVGFDVEVARQVATELKLKLEWVDSDFDAIANGEVLNNGECDMVISAMTITGDRARSLDFSSPYFDAKQALIVPRAATQQGLADFKAARIGVQADTTGEVYVTDNRPAQAKIVPLADSAELTKELIAGKVDAAVMDSTIIGPILKESPNLKVLELFDTGEQYGLGVKKDGNPELLRTINGVLARIQGDGTYEQIYTRWFGETAPAS